MTDHSTQDPPPTPLSDMVRAANEAGPSFQALADRATTAGHPVSKAYLHKIAEQRVDRAPSLDSLHGIAAALRTPLAIVQRAAAEQYLRYETTELAGFDDDTRVIVAHLAGMEPGERRRWKAMIEAADQASNDRM